MRKIKPLPKQLQTEERAASASSENDNVFEVGTLPTVNSEGNKRRAMITLEVGKNGVPTRFQIDSGAD